MAEDSARKISEGFRANGSTESAPQADPRYPTFPESEQPGPTSTTSTQHPRGPPGLSSPPAEIPSYGRERSNKTVKSHTAKSDPTAEAISPNRKRKRPPHVSAQSKSQRNHQVHRHKPSLGSRIETDGSHKNFLNGVAGLAIPDKHFYSSVKTPSQAGQLKTSGLPKKRLRDVTSMQNLLAAYKAFRNGSITSKVPLNELDILDFAIRRCSPHDLVVNIYHGIDIDPIESYRAKMPTGVAHRGSPGDNHDGEAQVLHTSTRDLAPDGQRKQTTSQLTAQELEVLLRICRETVRRPRDEAISVLPHHPYFEGCSAELKRTIMITLIACFNDKLRIRALHLHGIDQSILTRASCSNTPAMLSLSSHQDFRRLYNITAESELYAGLTMQICDVTTSTLQVAAPPMSGSKAIPI
ncbi:hypothetical protein LTR17_015398 [Elasticomyces elasticus]|nr:hypothetical protein LTR17_015398 [Elasticomyces elasticus]